MRYLTYVLCVLISLDVKVSADKKCPDCMNIINCDSAKAAVHNNNIQKIRQAFCGYNDHGTMVCCSYFININEDEIKKHPNINLLPNNCGKMDVFSTVGQTVTLYEFPWMGLIASRSRTVTSFHCAGTIITSRYILTTASCIVDKNIIGVRIGEFNLTSEVDCEEVITGKRVCESHLQDIPVEEKMYHEKYEGYPAYNNDIGLLRLASPIDFSFKNAAPICLPTTAKLYNNILAKRTATVTGWGLSDRVNTPSVLMKGFVFIHTDDECNQLNRSTPEARPIIFGHNQYCVSTSKDSCNSDSGSPLVIYELINNFFRYIQYGIMSHGHPNCRAKVRTMYTAIPPYMPWILDHIKE